MANSDFTAENPFEELLVKAQSSLAPLRDLLSALMQTDVFIPSASKVERDGKGFKPMLFDKNGETLMAIFTAQDRIKKYASQFPFCLSMKGAKLVNWIAGRYGVVINPGYRVGLEIPASGVKEIHRDFTK